MTTNKLDIEIVQARMEILKLLAAAKEETVKLKFQWEEISKILCKENSKKAA